jgi:hypothetical protein
MNYKTSIAACLSAAALVAAAGFPTLASAKGCLKGAAVGGVGGHVAGHHALLGAAAGCAVGHHLANKKDRQAAEQSRKAPSTAPAH